MMRRVLVACEESQAVTIALRSIGIEAYSCDIQDCSGGHKEWHIRGNVLDVLDEGWDDIIAFPPCTYLTKASASRLYHHGFVDGERLAKLLAAREFFMKIYDASASRIAIENPVPLRVAELPPRSQIIQPYYFGDPWIKTTCLWLRGYPLLKSDDVVEPQGHWVNTTSSPHGKCRSPKMRSKTFSGVARAIRDQWYRDMGYIYEQS